jgi:hypothetical protein
MMMRSRYCAVVEADSGIGESEGKGRCERGKKVRREN